MTEPYLLFTSFGTVVVYDKGENRLLHTDVDGFDANVHLIRDAHKKFRLQTTDCTTLSDDDFGIVPMPIGGGGRLALSSKNGFVTAHPDGTFSNDTKTIAEWEVFFARPKTYLSRRIFWRPSKPLAGTELMLIRLQELLGNTLEAVNIRINKIYDLHNHAPIIVWMHNEPETRYEWCADLNEVNKVSAFVFVSNWQRQAFIDKFNLPTGKCHVISNAIFHRTPIRKWPEMRPWQWRCVYISAPYRGLDTLEDERTSVSTMHFKTAPPGKFA